MAENEQDILARLNKSVDQILFGDKPDKIVEGEIRTSEDPLLEELSQKMQFLNNQFCDSYQFIVDLSRGKLNTETPVRNLFVNPYKQLQSELRYLTWQIQQIADGDYNQRVYFSGDFSYAINKMIVALRERQELANKLEESNATKDKLFSIIAHDLRNPFNVILGFSELLMESVQNKNLAEVEEYAQRINTCSVQTYDLLMNLLEWSRLQSGGISVSAKDVDLKSLILSNIRIAGPGTSVKNISIHFDDSESYPAYVDSGMLNTVLRNLLSNAIKFTPEGGEIKISVEKDNKFYYISIQDNGVGMTEETIEHVFQLRTIHSTLGTNNESGTGLGLMLCNDFVQMMGGTITFKSEIGKGTKSTFSIPLV